MAEVKLSPEEQSGQPLRILMLALVSPEAAGPGTGEAYTALSDVKTVSLPAVA